MPETEALIARNSALLAENLRLRSILDASLKLGNVVAAVVHDQALGILSYQRHPAQDEPEMGCSKEYQEGYEDCLRAFAEEKMPLLVAAHDALREAFADEKMPVLVAAHDALREVVAQSQTPET